jgi:hypothetical protein
METKFEDIVKGDEISSVTSVCILGKNPWCPDYDFFTTDIRYLSLYKGSECWLFEYVSETGGWLAIEKYISQTRLDLLGK